jgi:HSP20 family protein
MSRPHPSWGREFLPPLNHLQDELRRLIDRYRGPFSPALGPAAAWTPAYDLYETSEEYGLWVDLPGVDPAAVSLTVSGRTLTLRGEKPVEGPAPDAARTRERPCGTFVLEVDLGSEIDHGAVQAESRLGVLQVRLPKAAAVKPRTIPIQSS